MKWSFWKDSPHLQEILLQLIWPWCAPVKAINQNFNQQWITMTCRSKWWISDLVHTWLVILEWQQWLGVCIWRLASHSCCRCHGRSPGHTLQVLNVFVFFLWLRCSLHLYRFFAGFVNIRLVSQHVRMLQPYWLIFQLSYQLRTTTTYTLEYQLTWSVWFHRFQKLLISSCQGTESSAVRICSSLWVTSMVPHGSKRLSAADKEMR